MKISSTTCMAQPTEEINSKCQAVIQDAMLWCSDVAHHPAQGSCLFSNALDLIPHRLFDVNWTYSSRLRAVHGVRPGQFAHCLVHGHSCSVAKNAAIDVSGLPCPDMSTCGLMKKRAGFTSNVYLAHGVHTTANRTPVLLIECTPES